VVSLTRVPTRLIAVVLLAALPACTVTFRRKPIEPIDNDRNFAVAVDECWQHSRRIVSEFAGGIEDEQYDTENNTGLMVTDYAVFSDTGEDDWNHVKRVSYSQGAPFIGGRFQLTLTTRPVRDGSCKVRIVARIEGYMGEEYGYQALRSTGILEEELFGRIATAMGVEAVR